MKSSLQHPGRVALLVVAATGLNLVPIFLPGDVRLFLGVFVYMPLVLLLPWQWGILAAAVPMAVTIPLFGHPFAFAVAVAEAAWLGVTQRRWRHGVLLRHLLFWVVAGIPLVALLYWQTAKMPVDLVAAIAAKQYCNQFGAVAIASFLLRYTSLALWLVEQPIPRLRMRDMVFHSVFVLASVPLALSAIGVSIMLWAYCEREDREVLVEVGQRVSQQLDLYLGVHEAAVSLVAATIGRGAGDPAVLIEETRRAHPEFLNMLVTDAAGRVAHRTTVHPEEGEEAIDVGDQTYFRETQARVGVFVSPAFRARGPGREIVMAISAPILDARGRFVGVVKAAIQIDRFAGIVANRQPTDDVAMIIADRTARVIFANAGVRILPLESLSGHVQGTLLAKGANDRPIRFTEMNADGQNERLTGGITRAPRSGVIVIAQRPLLAGLEGSEWLCGLFGLLAVVIVGSARWVARYARMQMSSPLEYFVRSATRQAALRGVEPIENQFPGAPFEIWMMFRAFNHLAGQTQQSHALLREANEELDRRVAERTAEADAARCQAESASQSKSDFLAMTSHEIRTPLNAIIGLSDALLAANKDPETVDRLRIIRGAGTRLLSVVNDLIDITRVEAGKLTLRPACVELGALCREVLALFALQAEKQGLGFTLEIDPPTPIWLELDSARFQQVLINLVGNALKFTQQGSIRLCVEVVFRADQRAEVRVAVIDCGPGISPEQQKKLFQPFVQLPNGTSATMQQGSGLGLVISRRLVGLMGGTLSLRSRVGVGSMFYFDLAVPLSNAPAENQKLTNGERAAEGVASGIRILAVDDNFANQEVLRGMLTPYCGCLAIVGSGEAALAEFARAEFDVAFIDLEMPEMDGRAVASTLRRPGGMDSEARCRLIACSAHPREDMWPECEKSGFDDYLEKPIDRAELLRFVQRREVADGARR